MKYAKFKMVDSETGISIDKQDSLNGISLPNLGTFYELCQSFDGQWYYAKVDDDTPFDIENRIFELTFEEYSYEIGRVITDLQEQAIKDAYDQERRLRDELFGTYHESATTAGIQKYQESVEFLNTGTTSTTLQIESDSRGIDITVLAQKIVNNHNKFRETDAKLSGLRGKIVDRIKAFVFDAENPYQSFIEYSSNEYIPNLRIPKQPVIIPPEGIEDEIVNIPPERLPANLIGIHVPDLTRRWEYLLYIENQNIED